MVIDTNGNLFEERRKKDRRKNEANKANVKEERRKNKDRRDPKNAYRP